MRTIIICLFLLTIGCTKEAHHSAAPVALHDVILSGMRSTYTALGQDSDVVNDRDHKNQAYRLALHAQDEPERLKLIQTHAPVEADIRHYARSTLTSVERQRPGYPIRPILGALLKLDSLNTNQLILLLACTAQLRAESMVIKEKPGLQR